MSITSIMRSAPIIAQATSFADLEKNVTNISDPISASLSASKLIIGACAPPHIKYPLKCVALAAQLGICFSTGGLSSVTSVSLRIDTARQILEELA
jgi:hypothetical protein